MKINIKATGIELTPAISDYANKKISLLEKYLETSHADAVAQVEVGKSTKHHKSGNIFRAEVHLTGTGLDVYAVSEQDDLYAAIDLVKDEVLHNLTQLKGKQETLARRGARIIKDVMKGFADSIKSFKKRQ
jgi:putative sigma-54 modulation protein